MNGLVTVVVAPDFRFLSVITKLPDCSTGFDTTVTSYCLIPHERIVSTDIDPVKVGTTGELNFSECDLHFV